MSEKIVQPDINLPGRLPRGKRKRSDSILPDETESMDRKRRLVEQQGHRHLAKVHAREHPEGEQPAGEQLQQGPLEHPFLKDLQYQDGMPPTLSSLPYADPEVRRKYANEKDKQKQAQELRLNLTNAPKFSSTPRPRGPS